MPRGTVPAACHRLNGSQSRRPDRDYGNHRNGQ